MYNGLSIFKVASALAGHASRRQVEIARNMANAHTPGYLARDLPEFNEIYKAGPSGDGMRATRSGHLEAAGGLDLHKVRAVTDTTDISPNGNSVSIESEMISASEVRQQHQMALSVYRSGMDLLRTGLGRGR